MNVPFSQTRSHIYIYMLCTYVCFHLFYNNYCKLCRAAQTESLVALTSVSRKSLESLASPLKELPRGYSLKVINAVKKSLFSTVRLQCQSKVCDSLEELRTFIASSVPDSLDIVPSLHAGSELGYLEPGHGSKGKRCWLHTDADLADMYKQHKHEK